MNVKDKIDKESLYDIESICDCGHKLGWHHANMKYNGEIRICFGISCMCIEFKQSLDTNPADWIARMKVNFS